MGFTAIMANRARRSGEIQAPSRVSKTDEVLQALTAYCGTLPPGSRIPTHTELMPLLNASERAVREALSQLQRDGLLVRKNGVGTFLSDMSSVATGKRQEGIVVVARPDRAFFDRCMDLLYRRCDDADLALLCHPTEDEADVFVAGNSSTIRTLGYILFGYRLAPLAKRLLEAGHRVVIIGAPLADETPTVPCIYNDHEHGGYLATKHLIELGHRRIDFCLAGSGNVTRQRRWLGYQRAIAEAKRSGISIQSDTLPETVVESWENGSASVAEFFSSPTAPTAILAWNDHEAAKLLSCLTRGGIRIPQDVSLVGYDALPEGKIVYPSLTTVDHGMQQQINAAVEFLTRPGPIVTSHTVIVIPSLVVRESTGTPPSQSETPLPTLVGKEDATKTRS